MSDTFKAYIPDGDDHCDLTEIHARAYDEWKRLHDAQGVVHAPQREGQKAGLWARLRAWAAR